MRLLSSFSPITPTRRAPGWVAPVALRAERAQRAERGIADGLVRLSVGLETLDDILWDIDQALERAI